MKTLVLCFFLLLALTGTACSPLAADSLGATSPVTQTSSSSPAPPRSLPTGPTAENPPPAPPKPRRLYSDIRVQMATESRERIAKHEEALSAVLARLSQAIDKIGRPMEWESHDVAMEEFLKAVQIQQSIATEVIAGYERFRAMMAAYRQDLETAPANYTQAASYYRECAASEDNEFFVNNYELLASNCDAYARLVQFRRAELENFLADAAETMVFVRKSAMFLTRIEEFVNFTPGLDTSAARREFREQLKGYVRSFTVFHEQFVLFSRKLKEQAFSSELSAENPRLAKAERAAYSDLVEYGNRMKTLVADQRATENRARQLYSVGRQQEARRLRDAYAAQRNLVLSAYREVPLLDVRPTRAVIESPNALKPGQVFPYMGADRRYAGAVMIRGHVARGRYEVEPFVGVFAKAGVIVLTN